MVIGYRSHAQQIVGKCRSLDEEILRGQRAAQGPGFLVDQVLGEEGLEACKVVEEKDVSRVHLALMVQLEIDSQNLLQNREDSYGPLISGRVDLKSIILIHFSLWLMTLVLNQKLQELALLLLFHLKKLQSNQIERFSVEFKRV